MIPLHSIMAMEGLAKALPPILKTLGVVVLLLSFSVGFVKGFRRVSWGGLTWATAGVLFIAISKAIPEESKVNWLVILLLAMAVIAATCFLYGALGHYLRPKMRWVKDDVNGDTSLAEFGLEFEPEYVDYDGEHEYAPYGKRLHKTGFGPPCFFSRMVGGLTCVVNAAMIMWIAYSLFLLIIGATEMVYGPFGAMIQGEIPSLLYLLAKQTTFELIAIGLIMLVAVKGYKNGMVASIRALLLSFGGVVAFIISFYLPFSPFSSATEGFFKILGKLVGRCINMFSGVKIFGEIAGRLAAGVCIFCVALLLLWLINLILTKCCHIVASTTPTRILDSVVAFALYLVIGAVLCVGIWFGFAAADYFGVFYVSEAFEPSAHLTKRLVDFAQIIIDGLVAPYLP